jgi:hypothetical protein
VGGTCATLAQQQVIIAPAITERDTQNAAFMSPPFLPAEHPRSAARGQGIIHTARFYRESAASLRSLALTRRLFGKGVVYLLTNGLATTFRNAWKPNELCLAKTAHVENEMKPIDALAC